MIDGFDEIEMNMARKILSVPEMHLVDSSAVEAIGYRTGSRELYVRFMESRTYVYHNVEKRVFHEFLQADSKGRYLNYEIRDNYDFTKL